MPNSSLPSKLRNKKFVFGIMNYKLLLLIMNFQKISEQFQKYKCVFSKPLLTARPEKDMRGSIIGLKIGQYFQIKRRKQEEARTKRFAFIFNML